MTGRVEEHGEKSPTTASALQGLAPSSRPACRREATASPGVGHPAKSLRQRARTRLDAVNGLGATDTENGLGNIIVGYNEERDIHNVRTGSHNVVVGSF